MTSESTAARASNVTDCPWPETFFTPLQEKERETIFEAIRTCGVKNATDRFCAEERRQGWRLAMEANALGIEGTDEPIICWKCGIKPVANDASDYCSQCSK